MTETLTIAHFRPLAGTIFWLSVEEIGDVELVLKEVNDLGPRLGGGSPEREHSFSLIFRCGLLGPEKNLYLKQGTYRLVHGSLGSIDIFLVPVGPDPDGMGYEAVFN